ncbi:metallophosphoesterase family protein [Marinibacterium profundimaris]|uniref:Metallophosphoesterase n=1 Tax=Marinibacterium profundimaris TaxID=1679460 RepID=A0A225NLT0_9RHOB|nr:metallophosphoesterase [Marinibacterium profundimaris]OWU75006.1 metallophosphoesterase [Marinibacterium profundimaris]
MVHAAPPARFAAAGSRLLPPVYDLAQEVADLPRDLEPWPCAADPARSPRIAACLERARAHGGWRWPERPLVFVSDTHADADGFLRSLVGAGVIRRRGDTGLTLTPFGQTARIIIGGDCLDKGPSNLAMLDALDALRRSGADLRILAGNHDLRLRIAVEALCGPRSALTDHLFLRMGRKILPALREIFERYVTPADLDALPDDAACLARLLPPADWPAQFATAARGQLKPEAITREIAKLDAKRDQFDREVAHTGLSPRELLAAGRKCRDVFFRPGGPYAWFYDNMDVVAQSGSLLFVHAGICDTMCDLLDRGGTAAVNARYRAGARRATLAFYFGPVANLVRTKYRASDFDLTDRGVDLLHRNGVHMVVQGHVNSHTGQRLLAKRGLLHLEADVTLDRASRSREGLDGIGAGATLILPSGDVIGLSRDYPRAKHFAPDRIACPPE